MPLCTPLGSRNLSTCVPETHEGVRRGARVRAGAGLTTGGLSAVVARRLRGVLTVLLFDAFGLEASDRQPGREAEGARPGDAPVPAELGGGRRRAEQRGVPAEPCGRAGERGQRRGAGGPEHR